LPHKAAPAAQSIAVLVGPADGPLSQAETKRIQSAARILELRLPVINITADSEITPIFGTLVEHQAAAILAGPSVAVDAKRDQILSLAARFARYPPYFTAAATHGRGAF
jgi:hypothetical protein